MDQSRIQTLFQQEIEAIDQQALKDVILAKAITPREEYRQWEYGTAAEQYLCWVVLEDESTNAAIVYCGQGFGPDYPWGLLGLSDPWRSLGMDAQWFISLEQAVRAASFWSGPDPAGYEVG